MVQKRISKVTKDRGLPSTIVASGPHAKQDRPPSALRIFYEICMAGILYLIMRAVATQRIVWTGFPRPERACLTAKNPFAVLATGATLSRNEIVVAAPLEEMRTLRDTGRGRADHLGIGGGVAGREVDCADMDGKVVEHGCR